MTEYAEVIHSRGAPLKIMLIYTVFCANVNMWIIKWLEPMWICLAAKLKWSERALQGKANQNQNQRQTTAMA